MDVLSLSRSEGDTCPNQKTISLLLIPKKRSYEISKKIR